MGWIGVDLDGTLAVYDGWVSADHIGEPVPEMVSLVRNLLAKGEEVRIFTARVSVEHEKAISKLAIEKWSEEHLGYVLPITCCKDFMMDTLYDDRCYRVERNTGRIYDENQYREPDEPNPPGRRKQTRSRTTNAN